VRVDLNADVGEWTGDHPSRETDAALMTLVTTVNVACGAHAGDAGSMAVTVGVAAARGLAIGAHPGYPDREGVGRRHLGLTPEQLRHSLVEQIAALAAVCAAAGVGLGHVKAHGALYHEATRDARVAQVIAGAVRQIDHRLALFGPPGSELLVAARDLGLRGVAEGFADRRYEADGSLTPRSRPDAVHADPATMARQALRLATERRVVAGADARSIAMPVETICLHGDTPGVVEGARHIRRALATAGVDVRSFRDQ